MMNFYKYNKKRKVIVEWLTVGPDPNFYPVSDQLDEVLGDNQVVIHGKEFDLYGIGDHCNTLVAYPR